MRLRLGPAVIVAFVVAVLVAPPARAAGDAPTTITIEVPSQGQVGQVVTLRARLTDAEGTPLPDAMVVFFSAARFLNVEGDVELARMTTDGDGYAGVEHMLRRSGEIELLAEFQGSDRFASSMAVETIAVTGTATLYRPEVGVAVPWLNVSILMTVLAAIWGLYVVAAVRLYRLASGGGSQPSGRQP